MLAEIQDSLKRMQKTDLSLNEDTGLSSHEQIFNEEATVRQQSTFCGDIGKYSGSGKFLRLHIRAVVSDLGVFLEYFRYPL